MINPRIALVPAICLTLLACASAPSIYVHPNTDLSMVHRVAVLPMDNLTTDRFAAERVRQVLVIELLAQGAFDVVEVGEVNRVLRARNIDNPANLGPEQIKALGNELKVQALLIGSVIDYGEHRSGTFTAPEIAVAMRLVDVDSGTA
ncbi:MAG: CsgG/HfaB family protein, partial [Planctomycetota bacterium]